MNYNVSLLSVSQSDTPKKYLKANKKQWPWLKDISNNGLTWIVLDGSGGKIEEETVEFDVALLDGSRLSDIKNKEFLNLAISYAEIFRLYHPSISSAVHKSRVKSLLSFLCWLSGYKIKSLKDTKKEHLDRYAQEISYGKEFALHVPQRVFSTAKSMIQKASDGEVEFPLLAKGKLINRTLLYKKSNTGLLSAQSLNMSSKISDWLQTIINSKNYNINLSDTTYLDILDEQGYTLSPCTFQDVHRSLLPIEEIWQWGQHIKADNFMLNPFPDGSSKVANRYGVESKRTKTIPPKLAMDFISEAAKWVIDYSETIVKICTTDMEIDDVNKLLKEKGLEFKCRDIKNNFYKSDLNKVGLSKLMMAACFTIIASLSARRKEEIMDFGFNCIEQGDDCYWIKIYIEKTLQRYDLVPAPEIVYLAINTLEKLSESARTSLNKDTLWVFKYNDDVFDFSPSDDVNKFFSLACKNLSDEHKWHFTPHQFRRFFALIYYYRYENASIATLSYHLRHFDIEMTRRYITDPEFVQAMKDVGEEWTANFLRGVVKGETYIGGKGGKKINRKLNDWKAHFSKSVDVVARELAIAKMERYMKRVGVNLTQHVWGTVCSCPHTTALAKNAKCADEKGVPQLSNGSACLCGECPFSIQTESFKPSLELDIKNTQDNKLFSSDNEILNELSGVQIVQLEKMLDKADVLPAMSIGK